MTNFNFLLNNLSYLSNEDLVVRPMDSTCFRSAPVPPSFRLRLHPLRMVATLLLILCFGVGNVWGAAATLPVNYSFTRGKSSLPTGVTHSGLGSDYAAGNSPYLLKFDNDGDYIQIQVDAAAETITIGAKEFGTSGASIQIQGCTTASGTYSTIQTLSFSNGQNKTGSKSTSNSISSSYRYFRVKRNSGSNFGLGTLAITKAASCTTNPTVTAGSNSSVTATTATVSCSSGISSLGSAGCSISSYGFVLNTTGTPTISDTKHQVGTTYTTTGTSFSKDLTGLSASTTYYVRPYATNGNGTAYGTQTSFTTPALPKYTVTLMDDGDTRTQSSYGASVTLPNRTGCTGYTFAGWTKTWVAPQSSWTTTAPTIIPAGSYTPTANENLYPVYTKTESGDPVETKTQTFQYDTWTKGGSSTDKSANSYRLFHTGGYVESASNVDFSKLSKVIVYGGTYGGGDYNGISIKKADGTVWKNATVSGSSQTGENTITGGASLTGSSKLRVYSTSGTASGTGVRISKVEVYTMEDGSTTYYISVPNCCTALGSINGSINLIQRKQSEMDYHLVIISVFQRSHHLPFGHLPFGNYFLVLVVALYFV